MVTAEKQFAAKLASAARVLTNEHPAAKDAYRALAELRQGQRLTTWLIYGLVAGDLFIHGRWTDEQIFTALKSVGGKSSGLAGVCLIGGNHLSTYVRPFLAGQETVDHLTRVAEAEKSDLLAAMRRAAEAKK